MPQSLQRQNKYRCFVHTDDFATRPHLPPDRAASCGTTKKHRARNSSPAHRERETCRKKKVGFIAMRQTLTEGTTFPHSFLGESVSGKMNVYTSMSTHTQMSNRKSKNQRPRVRMSSLQHQLFMQRQLHKTLYGMSERTHQIWTCVVTSLCASSGCEP